MAATISVGFVSPGVSEFKINVGETAAANTVSEPRITHDFIHALEEKAYGLLSPILIEYERDPHGYTASFLEANMAATGSSKIDARKMLETEILDALDDWTADESTLGPGPRQQLTVLKKYIVKNP
jgi:hypothetical protein